MQGYDADKALAYIKRNVNRKGLSGLEGGIDGYLQQAQELDLRYMRESGVVDGEGYEGAEYYDEDEAFEFILDEIVRVRGLGEEAELLVASLLDEYMSAQSAFLKQEGLSE